MVVSWQFEGISDFVLTDTLSVPDEALFHADLAVHVAVAADNYGFIHGEQ